MRARHLLLIGRNALAHQDIARREIAEGHTVAYHTFSHPLLGRMPLNTAKAEINRGFVSNDSVLYGKANADPITPFFRFPGFVSSAALLDYLERWGIVVFGTDVWASDWLRMSANQQLQLVVRRIEAAHGGIVLFHDTKAQTAAVLLGFCEHLRSRGMVSFT